MTLKLLSQTEASTKAKRNTDAEKHRLVEVQTLITQKYKELSQAETDFADALLKQQGVWASHLEVFEERVNKLQREVEELEERRTKALIPLTEREEMLDTKASALVLWEEKLTKREDNVEAKGSLLTVKLDEVAERELQADTMAKSLTKREEGIQLQAEQIKRDQTLLSTASTDLYNRVNEAERDITLKWASVNTKEASLITREAKVAEAESGFVARERVIQDKYATLERATKQSNDNQQSTARESL